MTAGNRGTRLTKWPLATNDAVSLISALIDDRSWSPTLLSLRGRHDPRRIAQHEMIAFRTHFEVALVEPNHGGAVADGHDRRLR
jgi:hypothetical protein